MKAYKLYVAYLEEVENDEAILAAEQAEAEAEAEAEEEMEYEREMRQVLRRLWNAIATATDWDEICEAVDLYSDIHKDVYGYRPRYFGENYTKMCKERA